MAAIKKYLWGIFFLIILPAIVHAQYKWTIINSGTTKHLFHVNWIGDKLLATGEDGIILTSQDGINWIKRNYPFSQFQPISGALDTSQFTTWCSAWNGLKCIAVTSNAGFRGIISSTDGITWAKSGMHMSGTGGAEIVTTLWSGSTFVVLGSNTCYSSPDGLNWTLQSTGKGVSVTNSGTLIVSVSGQYFNKKYYVQFFSSTNGINWTNNTPGVISGVPYGTLEGNPNCIIWANNKFVVVGEKGLSLTSTDGKNWSKSNLDTIYSMSSVIWADSQFVSIGNNGKIFTSLDGISWSISSSPTTNPLWSLVNTGSQLVAVGWNGLIMTAPTITMAAKPFVKQRDFKEVRFHFDRNFITINLSNKLHGDYFTCLVFTSSGRLIVKSSFYNNSSNSYRFNVKNFPAGMYYLSISNSINKSTYAFMISH